MTSSRFRGQSIAVALAMLIVALVATPTAAAPKKGGGSGGGGTGGGGTGGVSAPTNLRVTGLTSYSVSLAWDASSTTSVYYYYVSYSGYYYATVNAPQTSIVIRSGINPGLSYTFTVKAVSTTGSSSAASNSVTAVTPADTTAPSKPAITVTDQRPTSIALSWSSTDDGPNVWYGLYVDGQLRFSGSTRTSTIVWPLQPQTTHSFVVTARDHAGLTSTSDTLTASTTARDSSDTTPPATPSIWATLWAADGETWLSWTASTDNTTPQRYVQYRLYVNGVLDNWGLGFTNDIVYGEPMSQNVYSVEAIDENGNVSARSSITIDNF
jgi:hypothetical protein